MTIIGPGLIEIFGLELATELIPYKGLAIFLAYMSVPLLELAFSNILTYQEILLLLLSFSLVAAILSLYFFMKIETRTEF